VDSDEVVVLVSLVLVVSELVDSTSVLDVSVV
jgi:hypothetical protein